jgi:hypothetical protein
MAPKQIVYSPLNHHSTIAPYEYIVSPPKVWDNHNQVIHYRTLRLQFGNFTSTPALGRLTIILQGLLIFR